MAPEEVREEMVAYATVDDVVHSVCWATVLGMEYLVLRCTNQPVTATRTAANPETITCIPCLVKEGARCSDG